ncbi:class I SAM-dependent DNA methyltransferase [Flavobacterium sp. 3HN19-14]|uniref:class I SAM-dependent DNA methyltransferase n=1 Tax=Flavobacterium sp. 3HN19-14 TaxID=3448133 RepID=UPI003EE344C8
MSYNSLLPLIKKTKSNLSPEEFQSVINVVFHDFEAAHYDAMHSDMRDSLQEQVDLLVKDLFEKRQIESDNLSLLDIGCGTGLSTQAILNSGLGKHIAAITLLDTSPNMLVQAEEKAKQWGKSYTLVNGHLSEVTAKFDIVVICSVLHHIPDLEKFLAEVSNVLNPGGILIHLQTEWRFDQFKCL